MAIKRHRLFISGRVQGVFFRKSAQHRARELGLVGFARNLPDGRVECLCQGEEQKVREFIQWAHGGPFLARVDAVEVVQEDPKEGEWSDFEVR